MTKTPTALLKKIGMDMPFQCYKCRDYNKCPLILKILSLCEPRTKDIMKKRFGLFPYTHGYTYKEIGEKILNKNTNKNGVSKERTRQMIERQFRCIRHYYGYNKPIFCKYMIDKKLDILPIF